MGPTLPSSERFEGELEFQSFGPKGKDTKKLQFTYSSSLVQIQTWSLSGWRLIVFTYSLGHLCFQYGTCHKACSAYLNLSDKSLVDKMHIWKSRGKLPLKLINHLQQPLQISPS